MQKALKRQILVSGLHIEKCQISDRCFLVDLPLESIIVNGSF